MEPIIVGSHVPFLDEKATSEFICVADHPVLEVVRILDCQGLTLLDGHGQALPFGAEPCWLTVLVAPSQRGDIILQNSAGVLFSPGLLSEKWLRCTTLSS